MKRHTLLAVLCVGVVVRYSPAQDYSRSSVYRPTSRIDYRGRYDDEVPRQREYRVQDRFGRAPSDFRPASVYATNVRRQPENRRVTFYQNDNSLAASRYNEDRTMPTPYDAASRQSRSHLDDRYVETRYPRRFAEDRYQTNRDYSVRPASYQPRPEFQRSPSDYRYKHNAAPSWPAYRPPNVCPPCNHGPTAPRGTYVADGILGQPILYSEGQPVRNFFRAFGL